MDGISRSRGWDKEITHCVLPMEQLVLSDKWARKKVSDLPTLIFFRCNLNHTHFLFGLILLCVICFRSVSSELVPKAVKVLSAMRGTKTVINPLAAAETSNLKTKPMYVGVRNSQTFQRRCLSQDLTQTSVHCDTSTINDFIYRNRRNNSYISESGIGGDISLTQADDRYDLIDSETNRYSVKPDIISQGKSGAKITTPD